MAWLPAHYMLVERLKKSQLIGPTPTPNSKAFWFAYFWEECGEKDFLEPVKDDVARLFNHLFVLPPQWDPNDSNCQFKLNFRGAISFNKGVRADSVYLPLGVNLTLTSPNAWDNAPDADVLKVMNQLLKSGFIRVLGTAGTQSPDSGLDVFRSALVGVIGGAHFKLGWRGDSRSVKEIHDAGGLINKADADTYAERVNLRAPWHPFSLPQNRTDYFYRKNKEDNCLATVVSVSTNFKTASVFPLLNADYIANLPATLPGPTTDLTSLSNQHKHLLHRVSDGSRQLIRIADSQQLYLVAAADNYFDTQQAQTRRQGAAQSFPEFAVKQIPETGVLGCVKFVRVHHSLDEHGGLTVLPDRTSSIAPTLDGCRRFCQNQKAARDLYAAANNLYQSALGSMPYHVKWMPNGHARVESLKVGNTALTISSVTSLFGKKLWP